MTRRRCARSPATTARKEDIEFRRRRTPPPAMRTSWSPMDQPSIDGIEHLFRLQSRGGKRPGLIRPRRRRAFRGCADCARIPRLVSLFSIPSRVPGLGSMVRRASARFSRPAHRRCTSPVDIKALRLICRSLFMPWERRCRPRCGSRRIGGISPEAALQESLPGSSRRPRLKVSALGLGLVPCETNS